MRRREIRWTSGKYRSGLERGVPGTSGVYALVRVQRKAGIPLACEVVYVGQSMNLRRRFVQHLDASEPNGVVHGLTRKPGDGSAVEFWWAEAPRAALNVLEASLIRSLQPPANRRLYKSGPSDAPLSVAI